MDYLLSWDINLFLQINQGMSSPILDALLVPIRHIYFWIPFYVLLTIYAAYLFRKNMWVWMIGLLITLGISDTCSSQIIKNTVQRPRPCQNVDLQTSMHLRVKCGSGYSFTSSHATNHMAFGTYLFFTIGLLSPAWRWLYIFWAVSIGFAQIYVGVHYPFDVLCGFFLGWVVAIIYLNFTKATRLGVRRYLVSV